MPLDQMHNSSIENKKNFKAIWQYPINHKKFQKDYKQKMELFCYKIKILMGVIF